MSETPVPPPAGVPDPNAPVPGTTGLASNIAAGLACLFPLVGGIVFLVVEKKDKFVRFWAMQSVFLGGIFFAFCIVMNVAGMVFGRIPVLGPIILGLFFLLNTVVGLAWFVAYLITVAKAFLNQEWEIPWLGKLARKQLEGMDVPPPAPS